MLSKEEIRDVVIESMAHGKEYGFCYSSIIHWGGENCTADERVNIISNFLDAVQLSTIESRIANIWCATVEVDFLLEAFKMAFAKKGQELELKLDFESNFNCYLSNPDSTDFESKWDRIIIANLQFVRGKLHEWLFRTLFRSLKKGGRLILFTPCLSKEDHFFYNFFYNRMGGTLIVESEQYQLLRTPEEFECFLQRSNFSKINRSSTFSSLLSTGHHLTPDYIWMWNNDKNIPEALRKKINLRFHGFSKRESETKGCFLMDVPATIITAVK